MLTFFTVFMIIAFIFVSMTFVIVPMREAVVVERLGKFRDVLKPGFHFLLPFFDNISYRHETREQVFDIPGQGCITRDNIQVEVDGLIYMQVMDAKLASYGIEDYRRASVNLAQTTMRSEVGKLSLGQTFSERDSLNETIVKEIDKASNDWGIKVLRYEIKNITPSNKVIHTLEMQMEAERDKRADITLAKAERESLIALSEGERQEAINVSEGEKQRRINESEGRAEAIKIVAVAAAAGIRTVAEAIAHPGGDAAVEMRLTEQFIDEFGNILKHADVSVVPTELATIQGVFQGLTQVGHAIKQ